MSWFSNWRYFIHLLSISCHLVLVLTTSFVLHVSFFCYLNEEKAGCKCKVNCYFLSCLSSSNLQWWWVDQCWQWYLASGRYLWFHNSSVIPYIRYFCPVQITMHVSMYICLELFRCDFHVCRTIFVNQLARFLEATYSLQLHNNYTELLIQMTMMRHTMCQYELL